MKKGINNKNIAISKLQEKAGMTQGEATAFYNRAYSKALRLVKDYDKTGFNVSKELVASMFYSGKNLFKIDMNNQTVELNIIGKSSGSLKKDMTLVRMDKFFEKYGDSKFLQEAKNEYFKGNISRQEFNLRIKEWKSKHIRYLISGY